MHDKEPQEPPEHTSEHVKSQNFLGRALTQSMLCGPTLCICPAPPPPNPLSARSTVCICGKIVQILIEAHACTRSVGYALYRVVVVKVLGLPLESCRGSGFRLEMLPW